MFRYKDIKTFYQGQIGFISKFISGGGSVPTPDVPVLGTLVVVSDTEITVPYTSDYPVEIWYSTTEGGVYTKHGDSASTPYPMTGLTAGTLYYIKENKNLQEQNKSLEEQINTLTIENLDLKEKINSSANN